jgi:hypothetical protein
MFKLFATFLVSFNLMAMSFGAFAAPRTGNACDEGFKPTTKGCGTETLTLNATATCEHSSLTGYYLSKCSCSWVEINKSCYWFSTKNEWVQNVPGSTDSCRYSVNPKVIAGSDLPKLSSFKSKDECMKANDGTQAGGGLCNALCGGPSHNISGQPFAISCCAKSLQGASPTPPKN